MSTISPAARRIARDVNTTSETVSAYYDADGRAITSLPAGAWLTTGQPAEAAAPIDGRKGSRFGPITAADVQTRLDVATQTGTIEGPDFNAALALATD